MQWYYADDETKQQGPFTEEAFQGLVQSGVVRADSLVWNETMSDWQPYESAILAAASTPSTPPVAETPAAVLSGQVQCSQCQRLFPADEVIQYEGTSICAECKPVFVQQLREGVALPGVMMYGGFWIRFAAKFLDGIILGVVNMLVSFVGMALLVPLMASESQALAIFVQLGLYAVQLAVGVSYTVFFLGKYAATPGKMACKLKVIRADGSPLTYGRACGRYFGELLSGITLYIGYIMAGFDEEKRALHDRVCDTRVIQAG